MCIAIIEVTYRGDQATDEPALIKVLVSNEPDNETLNCAINTLQNNANVLTFKVFGNPTTYVREERWVQPVCE